MNDNDDKRWATFISALPSAWLPVATAFSRASRWRRRLLGARVKWSDWVDSSRRFQRPMSTINERIALGSWTR